MCCFSLFQVNYPQRWQLYCKLVIKFNFLKYTNTEFFAVNKTNYLTGGEFENKMLNFHHRHCLNSCLLARVQRTGCRRIELVDSGEDISRTEITPRRRKSGCDDPDRQQDLAERKDLSISSE